MIKLVCGILFLMITNIHAEYLEDIDLKKTQKVLFAARASTASGTIYDKIYAEARTFKALKGADAESLFLNLYFSACFLEHKMNLELNPEKLSDNLYRCMLDPLERNLNGMFLTALDLTGILSRVNGMFQAGPREITIDPQKLCDTAFSRLITGRGRFQLKEVNEEKRRQLIFDIFRQYNKNDPMFAASKRPDATPNVDLLWSEIVGGCLDRDKLVLDAKKNPIQQHALGCFIVAYFASHSAEYSLSDYETSRASLFSYLIKKLGKGIRDNESMWDNHFRYFYDVIKNQVIGDSVARDVLDAFYEANSKKDAQTNGRLNQQFDMYNDIDTAYDDYIPLLGTSVGNSSDFPNNINAFLAHSLGVLSFQTGLTSYECWEDTMKAFGVTFKSSKLKFWEDLGKSLSKNPLRKSLFSFFEDKIKKDKINVVRMNDPRYLKEKTFKQIKAERVKEEQEKAQKAAEKILRKSGLKRLPETEFNKKRDNWEALKADWNRFIALKDVIDGLDSTLTYFTEVLPNLYQILNGTKIITVTETQHERTLNFNFSAVRTIYKKLSPLVFPDKSPGYDDEFKYLGIILRVIEKNLKTQSVYSYSKQSPLWNKDQADLDEKARLEEARRAGEARQRQFGSSDYDGNRSWF